MMLHERTTATAVVMMASGRHPRRSLVYRMMGALALLLWVRA